MTVRLRLSIGVACVTGKLFFCLVSRCLDVYRVYLVEWGVEFSYCFEFILRHCGQGVLSWSVFSL